MMSSQLASTSNASVYWQQVMRLWVTNNNMSILYFYIIIDSFETNCVMASDRVYNSTYGWEDVCI